MLYAMNIREVMNLQGYVNTQFRENDTTKVDGHEIE